MTEVDREQVRRVARLARLELTDEEEERLAREMGRVLSRFTELEAIEEGGDAPSGGGSGPGPAGERDSALRADRPDPAPMARGPAELAPEWEDGLFLVPRLSALGDDGEPEAGAGRDPGSDGEAGP